MIFGRRRASPIAAIAAGRRQHYAAARNRTLVAGG